ncbi:MAG: hypothetical protein FWC77_04435 [Defluviitaleaceae bacterium]|nr:hypothetical protein [Defluviitaleaceae bacterium]
MQPLLEQYNNIYQKIKITRDRINDAESAITGIKNRHEVNVPARITRLQEQIEKIDDYMLKINRIRKEAEKYLTSKNVQTVEAPPGYRVNLNRLRGWAMMINPQSTDDPYAQRINFVAKCDELFLSKKKREFAERIQNLKSGNTEEMNKNLKENQDKIAALKEELARLAAGDEVAVFADNVKRASREFCYESAAALPKVYTPERQCDQEYISPGAFSLPLEFDKEQHRLLSTMFGGLYNETNSHILLPFMLEKGKEFATIVSCFPPRTKELDQGLQNLLLDIINKNSAGSHKIYVIDPVRFNSASLGFLQQLENTFAIEQLPRSPQQVSATLEQIVASFPALDDILGPQDSVNEYNEKCAPGKEIPKTIIVLHGYPNSFESRDREYVQRIMANYERYGISFISISYDADGNKNPIKGDYAAHNAIYINMMPKETTAGLAHEAAVEFTWYMLKNELPAAYINSIKEIKIENPVKGK